MPSSNDEVTFKLNLDSGGVNGAAVSAADNLTRLQGSIERDTKALRDMQAAMKQLQSGASVDVKTYRALNDQLTNQKNKIASARAEFVNLGGSIEKIRRNEAQAKAAKIASKKAQEEAAKAAAQEAAAVQAHLRSVQGARGQLLGMLESTAGPLGRMVVQGRSMAGLIGAGGPIVAGFLALAVAAVAAGGAVLYAAQALVKYGFAAAGARREENQRLEGLTKMIFWHQHFAYGMRRSADSADFLQQQIDRVSDSVSLGRGKIEEWTSKLYKIGLRGGSLQKALEGVSIASATVGDGQANMYLQMMMGAAMTGKSLAAVTDHIKAKLGPLAEKQMLNWNVQTTKLRENLGRLFANVGIEEFLRPMKMVTDMFSQNAVTGRVLKETFTRMFKPLESSMPAIAMVAKRFIQGLVYGALLTENAYLKLNIALIKALGPATYKRIGASFDTMTLAVKAGEIAFRAMTAPVFAVGAGLAMVVGLSIKASEAIDRLVDTVERFKEAHPKAIAAGGWVAKGVARGITGGTSEVVGAIVSMGGAALSALRKKLGIASPSRPGIQIGGWTTGGVALGMRQKLPAVEAATAALAAIPFRAKLPPIKLPAVQMSVRAPVAPVEGRRMGRQGRGPDGGSITIQNLNVKAPEGSNPQAFAAAVKAALINELEGLAIELGASAGVAA